MTARALYREARAKLAAAAVSDAELTAGELLHAFCKVRREELLLSDRELSKDCLLYTSFCGTRSASGSNCIRRSIAIRSRTTGSASMSSRRSTAR